MEGGGLLVRTIMNADKKISWLILSCRRTGWVQGDGGGGEEYQYEGVFVSEGVLVPGSGYSTLRVRFWAADREGPAWMRCAIKQPITEAALNHFFKGKVKP